MRIRAAALIIQGDSIAVMERHRNGRHYFTFPGGGVDAGESSEQAVIREVLEELGLHVRVIRLVAEVWFRGNRQDHFLVEQTGGEFGTGNGVEYSEAYHPVHGTYRPTWMRIAELPANPVLPKPIADLVLRCTAEGWPDKPIVLTEPGSWPAGAGQ
jgi:8-oxo-dGTP pyrophosphatase MutT (NUDIX family)